MQCNQHNSFRMRDLAAREQDVYSRIPGMKELLHATPDKWNDVELRYPDAAFALMVANHLSMGNQEQNAIHQKAYLSILEGEPIQNVRFR